MGRWREGEAEEGAGREEEEEEEEPGPSTSLLPHRRATPPEASAAPQQQYYYQAGGGPPAFESFPPLEPRRRKGWSVTGSTVMAAGAVALLVAVSTVTLALLPKVLQGQSSSPSETRPSRPVLERQDPVRASSSSSSTTSSSSKPNIIFFVIDDLGLGDIDLEGASSKTSITPTLAALSQEGISLSRYYSQPLCTPARASLLTGKYPLRLGMQHAVIEAAAPWGLSAGDTLLPEIMKDQGYTTVLVGKWHVGHYEVDMTPQNRGFDTFYGHYTGAIFRFSHYAWHACDTDYHDTETCYQDIHSEDQLVGENETFVTNLLTKRAKQVITEHAMSKADDPLFLVMSYPNVHTPNDAPAYIKADPRLQDVDITCRRTYLADLMTVDLSVAEIVANLKENGMYDDTLLVVISDNGADPEYCGSNFPYRGKKGSLFEGGVLVPAFIAGALVPQELQGKKYEGLMHVSDWLPTIVQGFLKSELPSSYDSVAMDGINQWDAILLNSGDDDGGVEQQVAYPRDEIILNIDGYDDRSSPEAAIIVGNWKLVINSPVYGWWVPSLNHSVSAYENEVNGTEATTRSFLFHLATDPFERINLYETETDVALELLARLGRYNTTDVYVTPRYQDSNYTEAYSAWDQVGFIVPFATGANEDSEDSSTSDTKRRSS